jgi:hypothetical protein
MRALFALTALALCAPGCTWFPGTSVSGASKQHDAHHPPIRVRVHHVWRVPATDRVRRKLVSWELVGGKPRPGNGWADQRRRFGLTLFTRVGSAWRPDVLVRQPDYVVAPGQGEVEIADVTRDGRDDVLLQRWPGANHLCGPRQIFSVDRGGPHLIFARDMCETYWEVRSGDVDFDEAWYTGKDSMCCPGFRHRFVLHWDGRKLLRVSSRLVSTR